jgi:hypothetical protein
LALSGSVGTAERNCGPNAASSVGNFPARRRKRSGAMVATRSRRWIHRAAGVPQAHTTAFSTQQTA